MKLNGIFVLKSQTNKNHHTSKKSSPQKKYLNFPSLDQIDLYRNNSTPPAQTTKHKNICMVRFTRKMYFLLYMLNTMD